MNKIFNNVILVGLGDTHNLNILPIMQAGLPDNISNLVIIAAGDCAEGFHHSLKERSVLRKLYTHLRNINSYLIVCRGNHSNPGFFHENHWANTEFNDRIYFAPDYSTFIVNEKSIQLIGGGISIDRSERILGRSYWLDEEVKFEPNRVEKVDILISHVAPTNAGLRKAEANTNVMYYHGVEAMQGGDLLGDLANEQNIMQEISDLSECREHYFGHYHVSHFYIDPANGRKYIGLNINEFREIK